MIKERKRYSEKKGTLNKKHLKKQMDPRIGPNEFVALIGPSHGGKTSTLIDWINSGPDVWKKPIKRCLVLASHPEQSLYSQLMLSIPSVSFYTIDREKGIDRQILERELNIQSATGDSTNLLIIDDVS